MLFPLRPCPGLVAIRELELDIVVVVLDASVSRKSRTVPGHAPAPETTRDQS